MKEVAETLKAAKELIADEQHWTKGILRRDNSSFVDRILRRPKIAYCAWGALEEIDGRYETWAKSTLARAIFAPPTSSIYWNEYAIVYQFNDNSKTTHAEVLAAFDRAIEMEGG